VCYEWKWRSFTFATSKLERCAVQDETQLSQSIAQTWTNNAAQYLQHEIDGRGNEAPADSLENGLKTWCQPSILHKEPIARKDGVMLAFCEFLLLFTIASVPLMATFSLPHSIVCLL
jgi:hypothetical protein